MNLTHRQLEVLVAAADSESFSAAAQRLGISQPSLSESIRRIEREIGASLFERTTRSLKLTEDGRHAASVAREAVRDFKAALERLASRGDRPAGPHRGRRTAFDRLRRASGGDPGVCARASGGRYRLA